MLNLSMEVWTAISPVKGLFCTKLYTISQIHVFILFHIIWVWVEIFNIFIGKISLRIQSKCELFPYSQRMTNVQTTIESLTIKKITWTIHFFLFLWTKGNNLYKCICWVWHFSLRLPFPKTLHNFWSISQWTHGWTRSMVKAMQCTDKAMLWWLNTPK